MDLNQSDDILPTLCARIFHQEYDSSSISWMDLFPVLHAFRHIDYLQNGSNAEVRCNYNSNFKVIASC